MTTCYSSALRVFQINKAPGIKRVQASFFFFVLLSYGTIDPHVPGVRDLPRIYIHVCMCVCVCVWWLLSALHTVMDGDTRAAMLS